MNAAEARSGFLMVATGASPWYHAPHNKEARRADSFSSVTQLNMIRRACGNDTASPAINRPLRGLFLFAHILFHGLAPVANMNAAELPVEAFGPPAKRP